MKKHIILATMILGSTIAQGQTIMNRDAKIVNMVNAISADSIHKRISKLTEFHSRHNLSHDNQKGKGLWESSRWAKSYFDQFIPTSGGRLSVEILSYKTGGEKQRLNREVDLPVVMATLKGTDSTDNRVFLVSAHIDSRALDNLDPEVYAPGANDDGSGIAAIMEMVRIMSDKPFPATIKFMLVSGEEHGLLGAQYIAQKASDEGWNIVAMLNNDMIGNCGSSETKISNNTKVRVFSEGIPAVESNNERRERELFGAENDGRARQLARYVKEVGERYVDNMEVILIYRNDRFGRGGDHTPFIKKGFSAVRLCEYAENYDRTHQNIHTKSGIDYGDRIEGVDMEYVRRNSGINLAVLASLASSPYAPEKVVLSSSGLSNNTSLRWQKPQQGNRPKGYYVLIRESSDALWQKKIFTTECSISLPYSKDNYHFAVQAVGEQGHESIIIYPKSR